MSSYALKNEIQGKIDKNIDEKSNLSYLIIKDNKVEVKNNSILYKGKNYPLFEEDDAIEILKNIL